MRSFLRWTRHRLAYRVEQLEDVCITLRIAWGVRRFERQLINYLKSPEGRRKYPLPVTERNLH